MAVEPCLGCNTAGFYMESANYTLTDDYLTRLFSTVK